ncbi:MAG: Ribosomal RNA small subunit methyltransferase E [Chlamydiia bacterium]|nr:Ribosomal RNA small subunit methyltransferase E [Chlamydiia bacterium]
MPHRYFYPHPLNLNEIINLPKEELKHIKKVMRTKAGEKIEVINGKGDLATCIYDDEVTVENVSQGQRPSRHKSLALALTEPKNLELVIEKATELGIQTFYIFPSQKSKLKELFPSKQERLNKILISALKQSKRLFLPKIHYLTSKENLPKEENYLLADFHGTTFTKTSSSQTFIIGPESGFTPEEIKFFKDSLNAQGILLSDGVLRAETAALHASVLLTL